MVLLHRIVDFSFPATQAEGQVFGKINVNFSGRICECDWKRVAPIESSRSQSLCEIELNLLPFKSLVGKKKWPRGWKGQKALREEQTL